MNEKYRIVLLDQNNREVGAVTSLTSNPCDLIIVMPPDTDTMWTDRFVQDLSEMLGRQGVRGLVMKHAASFVRLEVIDP